MNLASLSILAEMSAVLVLGGLIFFIFLTAIVVLTRWVVVGNPSELLVISGKNSKTGHGYRTLIGGRAYVIPIFEKVSRLSLRNMQVGLEVKAQAGGGTMIPLNVNGVANVKVSSEPDIRGNAIERFLDQPLAEMQRVARETLEGGLRAVIGKMTPEEIVEDRDKFVATVMKEVTDDFRKLGLTIDSVNIQNVHDDQEYLESISRKASADVRATARQFEAQRKSEADIKEAESEAQARQARAQRDAEAKAAEAKAAAAARQAQAERDSEAKMAEAKAAANARQAQAERDADAKVAEALGRQKSEQARLSADKLIAETDNLLRIRKAELAREASLKEAERNKAAAESEEARLLATDVTQALAARDVAKAKAEGDAATIMEEGRARAAAIEQIGQAIRNNPDAMKVMLVEMLPGVIQELTKSIANVKLGDVTVFDSGDGNAIAGAAMGRARMLAESLGTLESILGIDLRDLTQSIAGSITNSRARGVDHLQGPDNPRSERRPSAPPSGHS